MMKIVGSTKSREIRAQLKHPVIDSDGHQAEFVAPIEDYVKAVGGSSYAARFSTALGRSPELDEIHRDARLDSGGYGGGARRAWWIFPTRNTLDRATAALPKLLHERMDDIGLDFTVLIHTVVGVEIYRVGSSTQVSGFDSEAWRVRCRAINAYRADICGEYADRMTPVAEVAMGDPKAAIEDLEHAVNELGMKAIQIGLPRRPVPAIHRKYPELYPGVSWLDTLGLDSAYNYDTFWQRCVDLKVPVLAHAGGQGFTSRNTSNYMYNHMGHFADAGEALCKSLFMGGVTRRFPTLRFAFLEGGVAWACRLYSDLIGHWEKRNRETVQNYNPIHLDRELLLDLYRKYGGRTVEGRLDQVLKVGGSIEPEVVDNPAVFDDFAACQIDRIEMIRDLFVPNFFFGCEADDPTNALAFNESLLPFGEHLNAVFSSDIGHWDVPDMTRVVEEAYEMVERGLLGEENFRDFTFTNPVKLFAGANPDFFKGTVVQREVEKLLGSPELNPS